MLKPLTYTDSSIEKHQFDQHLYTIEVKFQWILMVMPILL